MEKFSLTTVQNENHFLLKLFTSFNMIGIIVNTIFVIIHLSDMILGNELPIFAIYLNTLTHEFVQLFGGFINFEIFLIKYWIEFIWKSVRKWMTISLQFS